MGLQLRCQKRWIKNCYPPLWRNWPIACSQIKYIENINTHMWQIQIPRLNPRWTFVRYQWGCRRQTKMCTKIQPPFQNYQKSRFQTTSQPFHHFCHAIHSTTSKHHGGYRRMEPNIPFYSQTMAESTQFRLERLSLLAHRHPPQACNGFCKSKSRQKWPPLQNWTWSTIWNPW